MIAAERLRSVDRADVYKGARLAGGLERDGSDVVFRYGDEYLSDSEAPRLAWSVPKEPSEVRASAGSVPAFFAGLLPEGVRLRGAVASTKTSEDDHLTLLLAVGGDTIGDVRVVPAGAELPGVLPAFDAAAPQDLRALFEQISGADAIGADPTALSGVQAKVSAEMYSTPIAASTGPAILKLAPPQGFPRLVENEHFFMVLAEQCGLKVAQNRLISDSAGRAGLLVARFDRGAGRAGEVLRYPQEDACQVLGEYPAAKYRLKTETVIAALSAACERGGGSAHVATLELLRLVAYSYAIGNGDLHGKNFSIYRPATGLWSVTPAYDLLCTQPYLGWRDPMALDLYGRANKLTRAHLVQCGDRLGVPERAVTRMLDRVCGGVRAGMGRVVEIGFDERQTELLARMLAARTDELAG